ncbi:MAG: hypothetical protein JO199_13250, partial [Candidatus Eremiobacteraeota bacterium]|nr:hypothetical protein [Candidatus Eremiobacteraeota bacterium]
MRTRTMTTKWLAGALAVSFLASCSGGTNSGSVSGPGFVPAARQHAETKKAKLVLRIKIPKKRVHRGRHVRFISPSTQSMKVLITGTNPVVNLAEIVNLTPTSTGCTSTLTSTLCLLTVSLAPSVANYTGSVTTYDGLGATGNQLSTAQNISFAVVAGQANTIAMTLSGIPNNILILSGSGASNGNVYGGFDLIGTSANALIAEAVDADGNIILGSGSPTFTVSQKSGALGVTPTNPSSTSPNLFYLTPPSSYSASTATIEVKAAYSGVNVTDGCAQSGAVCTVDFPVDMQQIMGVANATSVTLLELNGSTALASVVIGSGQINGIAFDNRANLYVSNCGTAGSALTCTGGGTDRILEYAPPYTGTPIAVTSGVVHPQGIAYANGKLYVAMCGSGCGVGGTADSVQEYATPLTASSTPSAAITNSVNVPQLIAVDPANDLFVGNSTLDEITIYKSGSSAPSYPPVTQGINGITGLAVDASANLYVASATSNHIEKYFGYNSITTLPYTCASSCGGSPAVNSNPKTITGCHTGGCVTFGPGALL